MFKCILILSLIYLKFLDEISFVNTHVYEKRKKMSEMRMLNLADFSRLI